MKIIRITADNEISTFDVPEGDVSVVDSWLYGLIGPECETMEHVMPRRLYTELGASNKRRKELGSCTSMLMDGDAWTHNLAVNLVASWLYESDLHGHLIRGNVLIIGEHWKSEGFEYCGMSDEQHRLLYPKLEKLTKEARI